MLIKGLCQLLILPRHAAVPPKNSMPKPHVIPIITLAYPGICIFCAAGLVSLLSSMSYQLITSS
ncbi:MAG: hypothetical protein OEY79_02165 [Anaplasmataceae bacterium]|nr:hypothetical protein [Anaplasmataceae bacterium]